MNFTLRNRIAVFNSLATAVLILILFTAIYLVVDKSVYKKMDDQLREESYEFLSDYKIVDGKFIFNPTYEQRKIGDMDLTLSALERDGEILINMIVIGKKKE